MKSKLFLLALAAGLCSSAIASDHDDGELDLKGRALNITDVYVFREDNQTGRQTDQGNLILIMNTNPRSLPQQQYFFSTKAIYQFHLSRVSAANKTKKPTGKEDVALRFKFGNPDATNRQPIVISLARDGKVDTANSAAGGGQILTTNITDSLAERHTNNQVSFDGKTITVFAGLREDPFFFDVVQFFKVRAHALATKSFLGFNPAATAADFTKNYNVNTIVARVPLDLLQSNQQEPVFDVWTTIMVPK